MDSKNLPSQAPNTAGYRVDPGHPILTTSLDFEAPRQVSRHHHPRGQLVYVIHGVARIITEAALWVIPSSKAVWVPPETEHEVIITTSASLRTLFIDPSAVIKLPSKGCAADVSPLLHELILEAVHIGNDYPADGPARCLMEVLLDQLHELHTTPLFLPLPHDRRLQKILVNLMRAPAIERDLAGWAGIVGGSPDDLAHLLLSETGMAFVEWRKQLRLIVAIEHLGQGDSVNQVARELGYGSTSAFSAMFRQALGTSPTNFLCRRRPVKHGAL